MEEVKISGEEHVEHWEIFRTLCLGVARQFKPPIEVRFLPFKENVWRPRPSAEILRGDKVLAKLMPQYWDEDHVTMVGQHGPLIWVGSATGVDEVVRLITSP